MKQVNNVKLIQESLFIREEWRKNIAGASQAQEYVLMVISFYRKWVLVYVFIRTTVAIHGKFRKQKKFSLNELHLEFAKIFEFRLKSDLL